ncbi:MAG: hypothetical protein AAFX65_08010 [Cyanobacteria bacterium J06638_7]
MKTPNQCRRPEATAALRAAEFDRLFQRAMALIGDRAELLNMTGSSTERMERLLDPQNWHGQGDAYRSFVALWNALG